MSEGLEGLLAGRTLVGRYRIEEVIGRGGFAVVYRAEDLRLGRAAAVKVITLRAGDPAARARLRERFQAEARAAASLPHHPNLVSIHDFGTDEETGIDFLAMELLQGETLAQHLARDPHPPLDAALHILRGAAEGLAVGHRAGLVHRDVKPGNIFLAHPLERGARPRVCILDFGIARLVDAEDGTLTRHEALPLSPAYASPEQLRGDRRLTPASDVFSLGLVAHQLLTGRRAFGPERGPGDAGEPGRLPPEVPPAVAAAVSRALEPEPEARFPDGAAFGAALEGAVERRSAPAVDEDATVLYPAAAAATTPPPRRMRRRRGLWLLAVPALAAAAGVWALAGSGGGDAAPAALELRPDTTASEPPADPEAGIEPETDTPRTAAPVLPSGEPLGPAGAEPEPPVEAVPVPSPAPPVPAPQPSPPPRPTPVQPQPPLPQRPDTPRQPPPVPQQPQPQPQQPLPPPMPPQMPLPPPPDTVRFPPSPPDAPRR